nr:MAG TPA: hypothetical protein [Inoviridae sp.]
MSTFLTCSCSACPYFHWFIWFGMGCAWGIIWAGIFNPLVTSFLLFLARLLKRMLKRLWL